MHPLFVELHIHRKKQTENNSFNILKDQKCEPQFLCKLVTSFTSSLFSRNSLTDLRATLHAASLGYPYIPVEIQGKA